ncbi:alpha/beta hydrolase [Paenarthrobacter sp. PH39-S1]|uniref:alpha/beta fold hydrolase n=1 Tax=Paenarthrobacter sp. PH39-S1 TaxID=3046204 RepID=UPI0024BA7EA2|nr:alpha/beta hydrolase [Paenarthrobacter sp. PH39-S1]MDJ0356649.1 alpha/beta hydrolase [Paenarthrobacter sp. PH39-S1]
MKTTIHETAIDQVTSADATTISVERIGSGPALVLVDGAFCGRSFGPARRLAQELANSFSVYFYDRRGRGDSGDTKPYAAEREIEDLVAVIRHTGGNAFVYGISSGAALALEAAAAGVPMRKLATYEAPYTGVGVINGVPIDHARHLNALLAQNKRGAMVSYFLVKMIGVPAFVPIMLHFIPGVWKSQTASANTLPYETAVLNNFTAPVDRLAHIPVPTLVMVGGKAAPAMAAAQSMIAKAVPQSLHHILDGQTHQVSNTAMVPQLRAFFAA